MASKSILCSKSATSHQSFSDASKRHKGRGANERLLIGRVTADIDLRFRSFIRFDLNGAFDDVREVTDAYVVFTFAGGGDISNGTTHRFSISPLLEAFSEGDSEDFVLADYTWPDIATDISSVAEGGSGLPGDTININVMAQLRRVAPERVNFPSLGKGLGKTNYGFALKGAPEKNASAAVQFWSGDAPVEDNIPTLVIEYLKTNVPPTGGLDSWPSLVTGPITGTFDDENSVEGDHLTRIKVSAKKTSDATYDNAVDVFDVTVPGPDVTLGFDGTEWSVATDWRSKVPLGISMTPRLRVWDASGAPSEWQEGSPFTVERGSGTITPLDQTVSTLNGLLLTAAFEPDEELSGAEYWVFTVTVYDAIDAVMWTTTYVATAQEILNSEIRCPYAGPALKNGVYTVEYTVSRMPGTWAFSYSSASLTVLVVFDDEPIEEGQEPTTGYSREVPAQRIVIKGMDPESRGPLGVLAILEDFSNLGISWYASAPGELYFTLPVSHPQVAVIEPMVTHYEYQQFRNGKWRSLAYGLIRDFDANERDVVFYGIDYLGLLSWTIEAAKQTASKPRKNIPTEARNTDGSRYLKKSIKHIVVDQLNRARKQADYSPVKFIEVGRVDNFSTVVTIYASYVERLTFIRSLIDSHRGSQANGEERRSRLRVRWNSSGNGGLGRFQFEAIDNAGVDRNSISLEYGSIIQGYNIIALDDFATSVYGVGKAPNTSIPYFSSVDAPGISQAAWGNIARANFWSDIVDSNDLTRRARAMATRMSRVGKRVALGLRVRGIGVFDGYDILDSIKVSINDGVVDTSNYGLGWWTIWGMEYRVYDDGHDEVTFILRPKGDTGPIDPDLIPSRPIHYQTDIVWGSGDPA